MDIRHAVHPEHAAGMDTAALRRHFLIQDLFVPGAAKLVYCHDDRLIVGGVCPAGSLLTLKVDPAIIGAAYLLERREMAVLNLGGPGSVIVNAGEMVLNSRDALYVGMGSREITFASHEDSEAGPAVFYLVSAPAHATHPMTYVPQNAAEAVELGDTESGNKRVIRKYVHPGGAKSCQLVMGQTTLAPGCVWNTMPTHTHARRTEAYLYCDLPGDRVVFHLMGRPEETRHIVVREREVVLSPSWSLHSGVGTGAYSFVWAMAGENQTFTDMDAVPMSALR